MRENTGQVAPCASVFLSHSLDLFVPSAIGLMVAGVISLLLFFCKMFTIGEDCSSKGNQSAASEGQTHRHMWRKIPTAILLWHLQELTLVVCLE